VETDKLTKSWIYYDGWVAGLRNVLFIAKTIHQKLLYRVFSGNFPVFSSTFIINQPPNFDNMFECLKFKYQNEIWTHSTCHCSENKGSIPFFLNIRIS
jgi:hypothetical protein